jgi:serine phosphatase RsbU (regulator of sigma subunit)
MKSALNRNIWLWVLPGITGLILFAMLRVEFDFSAGSPVTHTKEQATESARALFTELGHTPDTLGLIPFRNQRVSIYLAIQDSLQDETPKAYQLNRENFFLHGWEVVAARPLGLNESFNLTPGSIYNASGSYRARWDNSGNVRYFEVNPDRIGSAVLLGEDTRAFAEQLVRDVFGHDLTGYRFGDENDDPDFFPEETPPGQIEVADTAETGSRYRWVKRSGLSADVIELDLEPAVHVEENELERTEISGVRVLKFEAYNELEKSPPVNSEQNFVVFFFAVISILTLIVFIDGLGQLFKGKADWKRILFVAVMITLLIYGWRFLFMLNFSEVLTTQGNIVVQFNQLIFGLVMGLFAGLAYIAWEAYARSEKSFQLPLIDAFWRGRFYLKETGSSIIRGFSLAGVMLGITALFLTISGLYFYQSDSQFGFVEILNRPFFISLNMSVLAVAALGSIAMTGVVYNFLEKRVKKEALVYLLAIVVGGVLYAGLGRSFGTDGTIWQDVALFTIIAIPLVGAYKISGVVTVFSGLWLFTSITNIIPYIGSPEISVALKAWIQISFAGVLLLFGVFAYLKAPSIKSVSSYIPDYEKKLIRSLRFENEMRIARITQEKLMPLHHPETEHFELFGYFIPSYEVGGDYFDYVTHQNGGSGDNLTLTVVDVSGKSMRAAMQAVFTSGLLRSRMYTDPPSKILREISPVIYEKTDAQTFITCIVAQFRPDDLNLSFSNAGHCLPILKRNGKAQYIHSSEPKYPLGVRENVDYSETEMKLQKGDVLLFYSDGFPEAVNDKGERIGFDRALSLFEQINSDDLTARQICEELRKFIVNHSIERLADDTTILCLKIR